MPGRILIIDDEPQITRVLRAALSAQGYDVRTANDPEEACRSTGMAARPGVTDLMMPAFPASRSLAPFAPARLPRY